MELVVEEEAHALRRAGQRRALAGDRRVPRGPARRREAVDVRERRALLPLRREHPRRRRVRRAEPLRADQRPHHAAAAHDRRGQARVGAAHHRGVPVLRVRPPGPQGRGSRADLGAPRSPTCSRSRAPTGWSASTSTPARSRASSTARSTTSPRCRSSPTTSASQVRGRRRGRVSRRRRREARQAVRQLPRRRRRRVRSRLHRQAPAEGHPQRGRGDRGGRQRRRQRLRARSTT